MVSYLRSVWSVEERDKRCNISTARFNTPSASSNLRIACPQSHHQSLSHTLSPTLSHDHTITQSHNHYHYFFTISVTVTTTVTTHQQPASLDISTQCWRVLQQYRDGPQVSPLELTVRADTSPLLSHDHQHILQAYPD